MLLLLAVLFSIGLAALHYFIRCRRMGKLIDKIPGPYAWPLIGNLGIFLIPFEKIWILLREMNEDYYPIFRFWSGHIAVVNLRHPRDVEVLLSSTRHIEKSILYKFLHPWLGDGLLTSTGEKWFQRRRILTPAFHFDVLQQFVGVLVKQSEKIVQWMRLEGEEVTCDLLPILHKYTINSICESMMGSTAEMDENFMAKYRSCVSEMGDIMIYRAVRPWLFLDWMFKLAKKFKQQVRALEVLHGFSRRIIKERKQYHEETGLDVGADGSNDLSESVYFKGKRRLAMLDLLISASKLNENLDDEGIREEVDTFVFEGHDTTAMALCFALLLLAENKEIQDKARAEVDALLAEKDIAKLSLRDINSLTYLDRCLKESLRLFPSVPLISRKINEDLQLRDYLIPGSSVIDVHIYDIHRDPNFWPNPDVFDPDRFLPENSRGRHPFAYVPFSAGPRNCIGQKFAMLELKVLVANILTNFYLVPVDLSSAVRIRPDLVLRPASSVRLKFVRRSHLADEL